jgi:hypothetical protein
MTMMIAVLALQQDNGLTLLEVIRDIPHDAPAVVVYVMATIFIVLVWRGSRRQAP